MTMKDVITFQHPNFNDQLVGVIQYAYEYPGSKYHKPGWYLYMEYHLSTGEVRHTTIHESAVTTTAPDGMVEL